MKSFRCQSCSQTTYFENDRCLACGVALGFVFEAQELTALEIDYRGDLTPMLAAYAHRRYQFCRNGQALQACNWLVEVGGPSEYCDSCALNEMIPDLSIASNIPLWQKLEAGKRRLLYSLARLQLPVINKLDNEDEGLAFRFLKDLPAQLDADEMVMTGHFRGIITINLAEADDAERERRRMGLGEAYRTVLGHLRHESGHYFWWQLIANTPKIDQFRHLFGDESADYGEAMDSYYQRGPVSNWQNYFISAYASAHPAEDWAESWAHYLTIVDSLETAGEFGVVITGNYSGALFPPGDSYRARTFDELLSQWLPLTYAVNSINRSGGQSDLYPFVLSPPAIDKLRFIHQTVRDASPDSS